MAGSRSAQMALESGWVVGSARYAEEVPHHFGENMAYATMHNPAREHTLALLLDGEHDGERAPAGYTVGGLTCVWYSDTRDATGADDVCAIVVGEREHVLPAGVGVDAFRDPIVSCGTHRIAGRTFRYRVEITGCDVRREA